MIEVLFGESEAASMKVAKSNSNMLLHHSNGPTATIGTPLTSSEETTWIQGNSQEVICLGFMLDVGDIQQEVASEYRKNLIYSLLYQEQWGKDLEMSKELIEIGNIYFKEVERLKEYIEHGESIRVWYSKSPYSLCGLYFLCHWMRNDRNEMYVVELPAHRINKSAIISYQNWGEVVAEQFSHFLPSQRQISNIEKKLYAQNWLELVEDNSPLRIILNNQLVGVNEDFYDFLIWKRLDEKPIKQARLIGDILGHYPISIGDWWYAKRIQHHIDHGLIEVVEDAEKKYARLIKKSSASR